MSDGADGIWVCCAKHVCGVRVWEMVVAVQWRMCWDGVDVVARRLGVGWGKLVHPVGTMRKERVWEGVGPDGCDWGRRCV